MTSKPNPLPLSDTLRDLALLRATDIDLSLILPDTPQTSSEEKVDSETATAVNRSYEFVREARAALKILNREDVEKQGARLEDIRNTLDDVEKGLGA